MDRAVVRIGLAPRRAGLTTEEFVRLWREHGEHSRARGRPGRLAYVQNVPILAHGRHVLPYPGFDVCAEATYESRGAIEAAFGGLRGTGGGLPDRDQLLEPAAATALIGERHVKIDGTPSTDAVKLMSFIRAHPAFGVDALLARIPEYARRVARSAPLRHEWVIVNAPPDRVCDVVDMVWFRSVADVLTHVRGESGYFASLALAGAAFGVERLIARQEPREVGSRR